jgi:hypothetical protein
LIELGEFRAIVVDGELQYIVRTLERSGKFDAMVLAEWYSLDDIARFASILLIYLFMPTTTHRNDFGQATKAGLRDLERWIMH